jgi:hypothetical protein
MVYVDSAAVFAVGLRGRFILDSIADILHDDYGLEGKPSFKCSHYQMEAVDPQVEQLQSRLGSIADILQQGRGLTDDDKSLLQSLCPEMLSLGLPSHAVLAKHLPGIARELYGSVVHKARRSGIEFLPPPTPKPSNRETIARRRTGAHECLFLGSPCVLGGILKGPEVGGRLGLAAGSDALRDMEALHAPAGTDTSRKRDSFHVLMTRSAKPTATPCGGARECIAAEERISGAMLETFGCRYYATIECTRIDDVAKPQFIAITDSALIEARRYEVRSQMRAKVPGEVRLKGHTLALVNVSGRGLCVEDPFGDCKDGDRITIESIRTYAESLRKPKVVDLTCKSNTRAKVVWADPKKHLAGLSLKDNPDNLWTRLQKLADLVRL